MIWECICYYGVGTLTSVNGNINSQKYIEILENNLWPVIVRHFPHGHYVFQDDNDPCPSILSTQCLHGRKWYKWYGINATSWPAQSLDINIIENIWLRLKRHLQSIKNSINSQEQLITEVTQYWKNIPVNYIRQLYDTIPSRLNEVIRMKGQSYLPVCGHPYTWSEFPPATSAD